MTRRRPPREHRARRNPIAQYDKAPHQTPGANRVPNGTGDVPVSRLYLFPFICSQPLNVFRLQRRHEDGKAKEDQYRLN